jgi:phenylalanyl-tRNA synthetase beta chain
MKLLLDICPETKITSSFTDLYLKRYEKPVISFDKAYINRYTGIDIPSETIVKTLTALGFGVEQSGETFKVDVPSWRATKDVSIKADLVEEVTRVYGYDNFPAITARSPLYPVKMSRSKADEHTIKDILARRYKLHEIHSYIWYDSKKNKELNIAVTPNLKVINAQTADHSNLRTDMIPSLLYVINENKGFDTDFGVFEIGEVFKDTEQKHLGLVLYSRESEEEFLLFKARDIADAIISALRGVQPEFKNLLPEQAFYHPKNTSEIFADGIAVGVISVIHPKVKNTLDKKAHLVSVELNLTALLTVQSGIAEYVETPKFPGIDFDLTIPAGGNRYANIQAAWLQNRHEHLKAVKLIDIYGERDKNITVRMSFAAPDRTLSMDEVNLHMESIQTRLADMGINIKK